jgi:SHS2 domain-containing protein
MKAKHQKFEFLEHTADIKMKVYGKTLKEIFENSVLAISSHLSMGKEISIGKKRLIEVSGTDNESLLYNFMDSIIYLVDAENFIAAKAKITLGGFKIKAELYGDDATKYEIDQIKAATYHEMYIKKMSNGWEAQMVLDV